MYSHRKVYYCEECCKEISRDEYMENNGLCNDCYDFQSESNIEDIEYSFDMHDQFSWLEYLTYIQGVSGSSPLLCTTKVGKLVNTHMYSAANQ